MVEEGGFATVRTLDATARSLVTVALRPLTTPAGHLPIPPWNSFTHHISFISFSFLIVSSRLLFSFLKTHKTISIMTAPVNGNGPVHHLAPGQ